MVGTHTFGTSYLVTVLKCLLKGPVKNISDHLEVSDKISYHLDCPGEVSTQERKLVPVVLCGASQRLKGVGGQYNLCFPYVYLDTLEEWNVPEILVLILGREENDLLRLSDQQLGEQCVLKGSVIKGFFLHGRSLPRFTSRESCPSSEFETVNYIGWLHQSPSLFSKLVCPSAPSSPTTYQSDQPVLGKSGMRVFLACSCPGEPEDQTSRVRVGIEVLCFQLVGKSFLEQLLIQPFFPFCFVFILFILEVIYIYRNKENSSKKALCSQCQYNNDQHMIICPFSTFISKQKPHHLIHKFK